AQHVAAYRLAFERLAAPFGDSESDERLARDVLAGLHFEPEERMAGYLRVRTSFFDRVVVNALDRGATQVAAIGAGYDGRALRYAKPRVRWFEVDHPVTQRDKRQRLQRLAIPTPDVTFVVADLVSDDVTAALIDAGFEPDAPSLLLCEGVAVYLDAAVLAGLLAQLRSVATAGTRLAMSGGIPGADPARREKFAARAGLKDPVAFADAGVGTLLTAARWRTAELGERAQRAGMLVGVPVWEPGAMPTMSRIGAYLERTFHRSGMDSLAEHLATTYGIRVNGTRSLDVESCASTARTDRLGWPGFSPRRVR
ncbi:MAG: SAM-dependent methyltransferase, partial [Actinomycetota bacterium]|nr:SAM-dependent methyltransferase [Actinomycetota bacterium]